MNPPDGMSLKTRTSLLNRLKSEDDPAGWKEFYRIYGGLIRFFAQKAGSTTDEAEEVVQETAIGVARRLPEFTYDPKVCRFKTWLLNLVRWRIKDQIRKRDKIPQMRRLPRQGEMARLPLSDQTSTATVERVPDPNVPEFGAEWDMAWEKTLLTQALERVRACIDERKFQIFDFCVIKGWPAKDVAQTLGITVARVYLTRHRVSAFLKKELRRLEKAAIDLNKAREASRLPSDSA